LYQVIAQLGEQVQRDRRDQALAKSQGKDRSNIENAELRRRVEELQDRVREYELTRTKHLSSKKEQINQDLLGDLEAAELQIEDLKRIKESLESENLRLRDENRFLEEAVHKAQHPQRRPGSTTESAGAMMMVRKDNEQLKQEVRNLKERVASLT
jgi:predicted phage tail protein